MAASNNALIGALRVEASLDAGKFVDGARKIQKETKQTEATVKSSFSSMGAAITTGIAAFVGTLTVGLFTGVIKSALEYAGSLGEVAQQIGVTTKDLQTFRFMAGQVGVSQSELETGLSKLTITLGKVAAGAQEPIKALNAIGLSAKDVAGLDTGDAFRKIADGLEKVKDRSQRAAVEVALFGKSGAMLDNMLSGGSDQINNLANAAERLGIVLSDEQIQKADATSDKLEALKTVLSASIAGVVADNADSIYKLADSIAHLVAQIPNAIRQIKGFYANFLEFSANVTEGFDKAVEHPLNALNPLAMPFRGGAAHANRLANIQSERAEANSIRQQTSKDQVQRELARIKDAGPFPGYHRPRQTGTDIPEFLAPSGGGGSHRHRTRTGGGSRRAPEDRTADETARFATEQVRADMDVLRAKQQLAHSSDERTAISLKLIDLEQKASDLQVDDNVRRAQKDFAEGRITQSTMDTIVAQSAILKEKNGEVARLQKQAVLEELQQRQSQALFDAGDQQRKFALDNLHTADQLATTAADHRRIQLQILDAETEQKRLQLEKNKLDAIRNGATKEEIANIQAQIDNLPQERANSAAGVIQNTKSPLEEWKAQVPQTAAEINEALQSIEVKGIDGLTDALTGVITGTESLKSAFHNLAASILADLIQMTIKMMIFKALQAAFGGGGIGAPDLGASMSTSFSGVASSLPGGFAEGGFVSGKGGPTSDSIPAMLSNGEFVINAKSTKRFRPFLEKLNQGSLHLAAGGLVVPRAPITQRMAANDAGAMSHSTVHQHFDLRGAVMTEDLMRQMDQKAQLAAQRGAQMGVDRMVDLNKRTFGKALK